jgi:hypothetical protein
MEDQPTMESVLDTLRELQKQKQNAAPRPQSPPLTEEIERAIRE